MATHTHTHAYIHAHYKPFIPLQYLFKLISPLRVVFFPLFCVAIIFFCKREEGSFAHHAFGFYAVRVQSPIPYFFILLLEVYFNLKWNYVRTYVKRVCMNVSGYMICTWWWYGTVYCDITRLLNFVLFHYYLNFIPF